jgi:DNA-binding NtrC family response regulator
MKQRKHIDKVLVVDDEAPVREVLSTILTAEGYSVSTASDLPEALELVTSDVFDLTIVDLKLPRGNGIEVLRQIKRLGLDTIGIVLTGYGSIESAIEALRAGAYDYITKPFHADEIKILVRKALEYRNLHKENVYLRRQIRSAYRIENIVGTSSRMQELFQLIQTVADSDSTVLILGESGTGKELVARAIHYAGPRSNHPLIPVNCGAIPEDLLESELFGHVKGAFTGAVMNRIGRFQLADEGTIFLDEIGDMSPKLQVKLLRILQEHEFEPVGATQTIKVNVRVIAATNKNLEQAVAEKRFREDLYYRLNVIPLSIPPLRERREDIPVLIQHFVEKFNKLKHRKITGFSPEAVKLLQEHPWPGNVRELENLVERMAILKSTGKVTVRDLPEKFRWPHADTGAMPAEHFFPEQGIDFNSTIDEFEKKLILHALYQARGVKSRAAELLGLKRTTLVEKIRKMGIGGG